MDKFIHHPTNCQCLQCIEHPSHAKPGIHVFPDKLYVVTMISNPLRWRSRYWNYWAFENQVKAAGAVLYTAEIAYGDRHFEITDPNDPHDLQLRTRHEIWHKENALNLLIHRLPVDAKYIAWIDADVQFTRSDWAQEALQMLQHYDVIQMFSHAQDLGANGEPMNVSESYYYKWFNAKPEVQDPAFLTDPPTHTELDYYGYSSKLGKIYGHPGFAWAARRDALDKLGCLIDWAVCGSADYHMAAALLGRVEQSLCDDYSDRYKLLARQWQERAETHIKRNVFYMNGLVNHFWHGAKKNRQYNTRWKFLVNANYDPDLDLKPDTQGLFQLTERSSALRDGLRKINRDRQED